MMFSSLRFTSLGNIDCSKIASARSQGDAMLSYSTNLDHHSLTSHHHQQ